MESISIYLKEISKKRQLHKKESWLMPLINACFVHNHINDRYVKKFIERNLAYYFPYKFCEFEYRFYKCNTNGYVMKRLRKKDKTFFFTFVRNPYDYVLRAYIKISKGNKNMTFEAFINYISQCDLKKMPPMCTPQHIIYRLKDINYNFIGRVENYEKDLKLLFGSITIKDIIMPKSLPEDQFQKYYTPSLIEKVNKIYEEDFKLLGYQKNMDKNSHYEPECLPREPLINRSPITLVTKLFIFCSRIRFILKLSYRIFIYFLTLSRIKKPI